MPLPLLALAGISAIPQLFKAAQGISQLGKANKVKVQDTTPKAFTENLNMLRQDASAGMAPGYGGALNQLAGSQAGTMAAAMRLGGSPSTVLGALQQSDARRQQGIASLATQNAQYQQQGRRALSAGLLQKAAYQKADLDTASRTRAALKQAGNQNLFSGLEGVANTAAYFGSTAGQNAVNGVNQFNPALLGGAYDSSPLGRASMRGYA